MARIKIAIDMGSVNTSIYREGFGLVLKEPTCVLLDTNNDYKIKLIGQSAKDMEGKIDNNLAVVYPIVEGCVRNVDIASKILKFFLKVVAPKKLFDRIDAILLLPMGISAKDVYEFKKVAYNAGVNKIKIVPKIIAAMNNEDSSVLSSHATVGVNIGGGSTDIAILVGDNIINGCTLSLGGRNIDASITEYVENDKGLIISEATSEKIKKEISSLFSNDKSFVQVSGIDKFTNESTDITIVASDIYPIIKNVFDKIILTINSLIRDSSVEIINDIKMTGIYVSGGLSNTTGAKNYLEEKLKLPIHISDTSQNATILGAGKLLNDEARLHNIIIQN